ncbi:hypothetical protein EG68_12003 [Paragonimus skrjabini miyazakii]|uniref:Uncharacterized protein n=1 Tax=Paragonimus skrjabini miyazakii TaxID=59628 RepID=A0A8S9YQ06_9TREM|nr:hypothetical protein EG68_12003 [Paragonimus skrjabini miyazakii]
MQTFRSSKVSLVLDDADSANDTFLSDGVLLLTAVIGCPKEVHRS